RVRGGEPSRARAVGLGERLVKWARRRPARATAYGLLVLVLALGAGGANSLWLWRQAEQARSQVEEAWRQAEQARQGEAEAKGQLELLSYYRTVNLAHREWSANEVTRAQRLLQSCPEPL